MRIPYALISLIICIAPVAGHCQSLGYMDADDPSEAIGMMKNTIVTAQFLRRECLGKSPTLQNEIDENINTWQTAEASNIRKAEYHWAAMVKKEPSLTSYIELAEKTVINGLDMLHKSGNQPGKIVVEQYCKQFFSDLASGVWRKRTPKTYKFLDKAP